MFQGAFVAIVTPLKDGRIDEPSLQKLIEFQIAEGIDGIVPCGTTGESATITHEEHNRIIALTVEVVNKRVPVIAGTGSNSTREAIALTKSAKSAGADGALLITPYYNKPSQEGLYNHFKKIANVVDIPQLLYNVPSRTGVHITPETVHRLSKEKNIIGIKDATGDMKVVSDIISLCDKNFLLFSGDDFCTFPILSIGGRGVISVTANLMPKEVSTLCKEFWNNNITEARKIHYRLLKISEAMFYETNPIPVKTALSLMGKVTGELRSPLCEMSDESLERLKDVMKGYELI